MSYEKATISSILSKIQFNELVLPAIQRDFVWEPERMYKLLDSIFRGYPFSTLLFWNTKQRVQYREFTKDWSDKNHFTFQVKEKDKKGTMVLDGQQRLQTLYLAIQGSYNQKILYMDLLSGIQPDDISQAKYHFEYLTSTEVELRNQDQKGVQYWTPLRDLANLNSKHLTVKTMKYLDLSGIPNDSEQGHRLSENVSAAYSALRADESLNYFTIDKDYGDDGLITDLDEILEIFVRINSGGQVLSKSDLMFSLMQMLWEEAADLIADLIESLNRKGRYDFDKDFILKCALVCCDKGAKYEVNKLRDEKTVNKIKENFSKISTALENCMEFVTSKSRFVDDRVLRAYNTLIPFVYFFFLQPNQQVKSEETQLQMNQALYLSLMTALFSRLADNYIDQVVNNIISPSNKSNPGVFPLEKYFLFMESKQGRSRLDEGLLQNNISYLMNILEGGTRLPEGKRTRRPEYDHIFPASKLHELGIPDNRVSDYANFRLISQPENNWKRAQDPQPYFSANPKAAARYFIPIDKLEYEQYDEFLDRRRTLIWQRLDQFFGNTNSNGFKDIPAEEQILETHHIDHHQLPTSKSILEYCRTMFSSDGLEMTVLQNNASWSENLPDWYGKAWQSKYANSLESQGICTVGDLALLISALKLRIEWVEDGLPLVSIAAVGPNGSSVEFQKVGKWGWRMILYVLEQYGFDWRAHVINQEELHKVRYPMT